MKSDLVFLNDLFAQEKLKEEYVNYKKQKTLQTLLFASIVKIHPGSDGVKWQAFEKQLDRNCRNISDRISRGKYFFAPMLEIEIPKTKGHSLDRARLNDDVRVISVSCIRDTLVQRIIYRMLDVEAEKIFMSLGDISFAYRKKYVAPGAAKQLFQHICDGYFFALDADLVKFFDNIPHILLEQTIETIYEKNS